MVLMLLQEQPVEDQHRESCSKSPAFIQVRGGDDQGIDVEETWEGRLWATVNGSWFPPGFHLVRKEGEVEVLFLGRAVIPLGGR